MRLKYKGKRACVYRGAVFTPGKTTTVSDVIGYKLKNLPNWQEVKGRANAKDKTGRDADGSSPPRGRGK